MYFRPVILPLLAVFIFASGTGCQKSEISVPVALPTVSSPDTIASVHWLGRHRLDLEANAYTFCRDWSLPETGRLQSQTFDRLATGFWRLRLGESAQIPGTVLRPIFDDLAQEETYFEIRSASNSQPAFLLAVHVNASRAGLWETNLAIAAGLLAGESAVATPAVHGWIIQRTNAPHCLTLTRVGDWTIVAAGQEQNPLLEETTTRIRREGVPFVSAGTNLWLEASLDLPRLAAALSTEHGSVTRSPPESASTIPFSNPSSILHFLSSFSFSLAGDGGNVITRARLTFSQPLPPQMEPWHLPVELMHEPLTSFTAVRGIQSLLAGWKPWSDLPIGVPPDQLFSWSLAGSPYQIYLAAPLTDARQSVAALTGHLLQKVNPWLATNGYISFDHAADGNGVIWGDLPEIKPFIRSAGTGTEGWLFAGLFPDTNTVATPPPAGLIQDVMRRTNLMYYDWEVTGPRLQPCLQLSQTARQIARQPQLPMDSASLNWLAVLVPRLGTSATIVNRTGPAELTFYRRATIGLTAPELHLLAGWLESPRFPQ